MIFLEAKTLHANKKCEQNTFVCVLYPQSNLHLVKLSTCQV